MLFEGLGFCIRRLTRADLPSMLEVYRQCEDFLALGPVAQASEAMVLADLALSEEAHGQFCGIYRPDDGALLGVLDFIERNPPYISLLMIAAPYRSKGLGASVVLTLETYLLQRDPSIRAIEAGVQVNNPKAVRFWQRMGFSIVSEPELFPDGSTAVALRKMLALYTPRN